MISREEIKMVSILEPKPYGVIKPLLRKSDRISIAFCKSCPTLLGFGEEEVNLFVKKLKRDGFNVVDIDTVSLGCHYPKVKEQHKNLKGDVILVWGCDSHVYNLKRLFPKRKVLPTMTVIGLGVADEEIVHVVNEYMQE